MEVTKTKPMLAQIKTDDDGGATIRIGSKHAEILKKGKDEINKDSTYKKKISLCRYVEKLIEDNWERPIEALKKEREGAKDWLELEYDKEAPSIPFYDWLKLRLETANKRQPKKKKSEVLK